MRAWGSGRACLVFGDGEVRGALAAALAKVALVVEGVAGEAAARAALTRAPLPAAIVACGPDPAALAALLAAARQRQPEVPVLVIGARDRLDDAVEVMRAGAADYVAPPLDVPLVLVRLQRLLDVRGLPGPSSRGAGDSASAADFPDLIGTSPAMQRVHSTIEKVARYKTNVLLLGESGTGKELVASALHARGPRRHQLFVPLNCATLGRELLENELFGHERGAFTGANERKQGLLELADGGTLFLDEIAEMDPATQAKLLRVLERNEFRRVGGTEKVKVDLSLIAATHRNLPDLIAASRFREDLYYRLKVVTLVVPPLRARKEDIPALVDFFIADFNRRNDGRIAGISPQLLRRFMAHDWPGNVRELKHAVESGAILAAEPTIDADGFEGRSSPACEPAAEDAWGGADDDVAGGELRIPLTASLAEVERRVILAHVRRSVTKREAAQSLGIGLRTLYTKLRALT